MEFRPLLPFKFKFIKKNYSSREINYLDVGCGNHSPSITKKLFPQWNYYGVDREDYAIDDRDKQLMCEFYKVDLSSEPLDQLPDEFYDVIMISHVIEHLPNGLTVLADLVAKLKSEGRLYVEFPSVRSLNFPSMPGCLNFCDDLTHVRVYSLHEVANLLLANGCRIVRAGTRRDKVRIFLCPVIALAKLLRDGKLSGGSFWDVFGFAEYVYA